MLPNSFAVHCRSGVPQAALSLFLRTPSDRLGSGEYSTVGCFRTGCGYKLINSRNSGEMSERTGRPKAFAVS
jgi:hypothetical protein